jgi:hypothetical protein
LRTGVDVRGSAQDPEATRGQQSALPVVERVRMVGDDAAEQVGEVVTDRKSNRSDDYTA